MSSRSIKAALSSASRAPSKTSVPCTRRCLAASRSVSTSIEESSSTSSQTPSSPTSTPPRRQLTNPPFSDKKVYWGRRIKPPAHWQPHFAQLDATMAAQSTTTPATTSSNAYLPSQKVNPVTLINSQPTKYIIARLHTTSYLLHERDTLTIQKLKSTPPVGSVIKLDRIHEVGSRDYKLKSEMGKVLGGVECQLTVLEHTKGPIRFHVKKTPRRHNKKVKQNVNQFTRLRVGPITLSSTSVIPDPQAPNRDLSTLNKNIFNPAVYQDALDTGRDWKPPAEEHYVNRFGVVSKGVNKWTGTSEKSWKIREALNKADDMKRAKKSIEVLEQERRQVTVRSD